MIIDFEGIEQSVFENFRGGEKEFSVKIFSDELNRVLYGKLAPGASIGMHSHDEDCEVVYILQGQGKAISDEGQERVSPGVCHYCPKGHSHSLVNDGDEDLVFFGVVPRQ